MAYRLRWATPSSIRKNGTIDLPLIGAVRLEGLTVEEAHDEVRRVYLEEGILPQGREAVMLTLMQPRQYRVMVFRQEVGGFAAGGLGDIATSNVKQGTGHVIDLRAYENDLLNALSYTGGLPGLDAYDGIFIFRGGISNAELTDRLRNPRPDEGPQSWSELGVEIVHIPTRWPAWEPIPFQPEDVLLEEGDVVFIEVADARLLLHGRARCLAVNTNCRATTIWMCSKRSLRFVERCSMGPSVATT